MISWLTTLKTQIAKQIQTKVEQNIVVDATKKIVKKSP